MHSMRGYAAPKYAHNHGYAPSVGRAATHAQVAHNMQYHVLFLITDCLPFCLSVCLSVFTQTLVNLQVLALNHNLITFVVPQVGALVSLQQLLLR
jgi:hypothetical protein